MQGWALSRLTDVQREKVTRGICKHAFCRKKRIKDCYECATHIKRAYAKRHPVKYAWMVLRNNAKRRGKTFTLTFDEFCAFNKKENYVEQKGIHADDLSIDRKDNDKGYSKNNIQALTVGENSSKSDKDYCPF